MFLDVYVQFTKSTLIYTGFLIAISHNCLGQPGAEKVAVALTVLNRLSTLNIRSALAQMPSVAF